VRRGRLGQDGVQSVFILGGPQTLQRPRITHEAGNPRHRLQMIPARTLLREEEENEVDRLLVDGLEVDRFAEPREQAN